MLPSPPAGDIGSVVVAVVPGFGSGSGNGGRISVRPTCAGVPGCGIGSSAAHSRARISKPSAVRTVQDRAVRHVRLSIKATLLVADGRSPPRAKARLLPIMSIVQGRTLESER